MAYADATTRPNTTSLLISAGVNTALIGAIFLAAPDVSELAPSVITEIFTPAHETPVEPDKPLPEKPIAKADPRPYVAPKSNDTLPSLGEGLVLPKGGDLVLPPGPAIDPEPFVPATPASVIVNARPDPRYASSRQPDYPPGMIREGREGVVTVRVLVGADGRVRQVVVVSAEAPEFAVATERHALKKWRFIPATRDGNPIESWREMTVRFEIP